MNRKQLREEYEDITGKKPFTGWSADLLQEKIQRYKEENNIKEVVVTSAAEALKKSLKTKPVVAEVKVEEDDEAKRIKEAAEINSRSRQTVFEIAPVWINGKPFGIIDDKYVPWAEAELIILNRQKEEIEKKITKKQQELETAEINS